MKWRKTLLKKMIKLIKWKKKIKKNKKKSSI